MPDGQPSEAALELIVSIPFSSGKRRRLVDLDGFKRLNDTQFQSPSHRGSGAAAKEIFRAAGAWNVSIPFSSGKRRRPSITDGQKKQYLRFVSIPFSSGKRRRQGQKVVLEIH